MCALLHCCEKARVSIRAPLSCSDSSRQGFAASPLPVCRNGEGGAKIPSGKGLQPYQRWEEEEERKRGRERGHGEVCVHVCVSVCPAERKCQLSHECPTSLSQWQAAPGATCNPGSDPCGGQRHHPWEHYYVEGKKNSYFLYIATITELRQYTDTVVSLYKRAHPGSLFLVETHPLRKINLCHGSLRLQKAAHCPKDSRKRQTQRKNKQGQK